MNTLHLNRRRLLGLAGAVGASVIDHGSWNQTPSDASMRPLPPPLPLPSPREINKYRPVSISDARDLPHLPAEARLIHWPWARSRHKSIQDALSTLGVNDILVLPEDEQPFEVDTSHGFQVTSRNYHSMAATTSGIVGLGPGAAIRPSVSTFRMSRQTYSAGLQEKLLESRQAGAYFGNFTMYGQDFGGAAYNAIWASGSDTIWERIYFRGAQRGWLSYPPGEAGAICGYHGRNMQVYNCEIDCRDEYGKSVGTSPVMWNAQEGVTLRDVYTHHTYTGMPTFWRVHNATCFNLIHAHVAQGLPRSPGVNVEKCSGNFIFDDCTFIIDYGPKNHRLHLNTGGQTSSIHFNIRNPTIDAGPWPGRFAIQEYATDAQLSSDYKITNASGAYYPRHIAR